MDVDYLSLQRITAQHGDEIAKVATQVIASGRYLQGPHVAQFERDYAAYTHTRHCVTCGNGLDALTIMLRAYKAMGVLSDGDEVLVPANTYIATILAITATRLVPRLIEPNIHTFQIDDSRLEEAITTRTKAIMIVHLYGYNALTDTIVRLCHDHHLLLLQDCAQAHGLQRAYPEIYTTPLPGAQAHSFYPGKNLGALADAGAITSNDSELIAVARAIANYGSTEKYVFKYLGCNSRMDELTAAVLSVKLQYLDADNARRQQIAQQYVDNIHHPDITLPPLTGVHHIFPLLSPRRDELQQYLLAQHIHTLIHYPIPPHQQACYPQWHHLNLPITEQIHREELSIPLNQAMTTAEVHYVINTINRFE